jgi:hypothetical protein
MGQLDATPADPWVIAPARFQRGVGGDGLARLGDLRLARIDKARQHQRLRARAFDQAAVDKRLIDADLGGFRGRFGGTWGRLGRLAQDMTCWR